MVSFFDQATDFGLFGANVFSQFALQMPWSSSSQHILFAFFLHTIVCFAT